MSQCVRMLGLMVALTIFAADMATKAFMYSTLSLAGGLIDFLPFLDLRLGFNRGISFGLLSSQSWWVPWGLATIAFGISAFLSIRLWRSTTWVEATWIGLIIGGALGNAVDRLVDGTVTDFLDAHIYGYHWPTFNLADIAIVVGVAILLFDGAGNTKDDRSDPQSSS